MTLADDPAQTAPPTMRAWTHSQAGTPSTVLRFSSDVKTPALTSPTDVLVRITHASLSPAGSIMMQFCPFIFRSKPAIPELDFTGTLIAVGADVPKDRNLAPGDAVFGSVTVRPHLNAGAGALAEYVVVAASSVMRKPESIALQEAAGLGVCGCTALMLYDRAGLKAGDSVLINGASGGIGTMVTQLARHAVGPSGRIIALCSGKNAKMVRSLGADEVRDLGLLEPISLSMWRWPRGRPSTGSHKSFVPRKLYLV
jgi:NADPH:quinone reductase-like Zn-dependent oxidoreductase